LDNVGVVYPAKTPDGKLALPPPHPPLIPLAIPLPPGTIIATGAALTCAVVPVIIPSPTLEVILFKLSPLSRTSRAFGWGCSLRGEETFRVEEEGVLREGLVGGGSVCFSFISKIRWMLATSSHRVPIVLIITVCVRIKSA